MPEPRDSCRPVTLPSGETIRVIVDAARRLHAERNPPDEGAPELWARVAAVRKRAAFHGEMRDLARDTGLRFVVLFRLAQGRMPGEADLLKLEHWLEANENA